jgi:hypothetical protein
MRLWNRSHSSNGTAAEIGQDFFRGGQRSLVGIKVVPALLDRDPKWNV